MNNICTCPDTACPHHHIHTGGDCTPCIEKNLAEHEIPACFWHKIGQTGGTNSAYSIYEFAKKALSAPAASAESASPDIL